MATAKPLKTNLLPLGKIAPSAGTPLALTSNYTDLGSEPAAGIFVRALAGNTGNVYILNSSAAADKTNYLNVLDVLPAGGSWAAASIAVNTMIPAQYYLDVDVGGEGAIVWIGQV